MAARTYADAAAAYAFLTSAQGRIRGPTDFGRNVRHATLQSADPFRHPDRAGVLALAFLFALALVPRVYACPTCQTEWPLSQRVRRRHPDGDDDDDERLFFQYYFEAPLAAPDCCKQSRHRRIRSVLAGTFLADKHVADLMDWCHAFVAWAFGIPATVVCTELHHRGHHWVPDAYRLFRQRAGVFVAHNAHLRGTTRAEVDETFLNNWKRGNAFQASPKSAQAISFLVQFVTLYTKASSKFAKCSAPPRAGRFRSSPTAHQMTSKAHQCDANLSSRRNDVLLVCFGVILMCSVIWRLSM